MTDKTLRTEGNFYVTLSSGSDLSFADYGRALTLRAEYRPAFSAWDLARGSVCGRFNPRRPKGKGPCLCRFCIAGRVALSMVRAEQPEWFQRYVERQP